MTTRTRRRWEIDERGICPCGLSVHDPNVGDHTCIEMQPTVSSFGAPNGFHVIVMRYGGTNCAIPECTCRRGYGRRGQFCWGHSRPGQVWDGIAWRPFADARHGIRCMVRETSAFGCDI